VLQLPEIERARLIEAEWEAGAADGCGGKYMVEITIYANNRSGLLADISKIMTDNNIDIQAMHSKASKQGIATTSMAFEVSTREELNRIAEKLKLVPSVLDVDRQANG
jgi:GTP pyrophosphokinase